MTGNRELIRGVFLRGPIYCFVRRIPNDLRQKILGRSITLPVRNKSVTITFKEQTNDVRLSLRTRSKQEAERIGAKLWVYVGDFFAELRSGAVVELTHRQIISIAGDYYAAWSRDPDCTPPPHYLPPLDGLLQDGPILDFHAESRRLLGVGDLLRELYEIEGDALRHSFFDNIAASLLAERGIKQVTELCKKRLVSELANVLPLALEARARLAAGDYRQDEYALRFPDSPSPEASLNPAITPIPVKGAIPFEGLVDGWWAEAEQAGKSPTTHYAYRSSIKRLQRFVGHNDARRVSHEDILKFKEHRLASQDSVTKRTLNPRSFKTTDLNPLKSVFQWGVEQKLLASNPVGGVTLKFPRKVKLRDKTFTDEEVTELLSAAYALSSKRRLDEYEQLCRWVPWLCAYTGARVGEILQLRKQDIKKVSGSWVLTLTPEAYTIKTKELRDIPIHEHLLAMGLVEFVKGWPEEYLFVSLKREGSTFASAWKSRKNVIAKFARKYIADPNVAPNHGWRHTFKSKGFEAGIQEKVLDAICGHAPSTVGRAYGSVSLKTKVEAIKAFPRFIVEERKANAS